MRKVRDVLRIYFESQLNPRQIALICGVGKGTEQRYLEHQRAADLGWPLPADLDDVALERRLFPPPVASPKERPPPDRSAIHKELKSRGRDVTLTLRSLPAAQSTSPRCPFYGQVDWICNTRRLLSSYFARISCSSRLL